MKAIVQERFGPPDVLQFVDIDQPEIGPDDVLVRVHAAALNPYDWHILRGDPYVARLMGTVGLTRPKPRVAGVDGAGRRAGGRRERARAAGRATRCSAGSRVRSPSTPAPRRTWWCPSRRGSPSSRRPAVTMAGQTALRAIRDVGPGAGRAPGAGQRGRRRRRQLRRPDRDGARRGGHRRVQHRQRRSRPVDRRRPRHRLHAGRLHRRARALRRDPGQRGQPSAASPAPGADPDRDPRVQRRRPTRRSACSARSAGSSACSPSTSSSGSGSVHSRTRWTREHLLAVTELVEAGKVTPVVGRTYPLADTAAGLRHLEQGHARGKVVVTVS